MKHNFIDQYSGLNSFIHRLDPRTKFIAVLAFILVVLTTPPTRWQAFAFYFGLIAGLFLLSRLPPLYVLKRSLVIVPFVLLIALFVPFFKQGEVAGSFNIGLWQISVSYEGLTVLWNAAIKAWLSVLSLILLSATTRLPDLLKGLQQLGMPGVMVMLLSFMYRYTFVLVDEIMRMRRARDSRNFGGRHSWQIKTIGNMLGTLFIRSYERGERVYAAMLARGFDGQIRTLSTLSFRRADLYFGFVFFLLLVLSGSFLLYPGFW